MNVLIKGMDMPCMCCLCPCHDWDAETDRYYCQALKGEPRIVDENTRRDDCPLRKIFTPHGRLIDANELKQKMIKYGFKAPDMTVTEFIEDELTAIIEAEAK